MKIILKYILNNIKERKLRTVVMLLSIVLSTTLLFVSLAIGDSYNSAQQKMAKGFAGTATISVSAKPDASGNMVWISEGEIPRLASIKNKVGFLTVSALYNEDDYYENIDLIAADLNELNTINKPRLVDDAELTAFTGYSIVLPEKFTAKYGIKPGDAINLTIGAKEYDFKLAAIAAYDKVFLRQTRGFNALIPKETLSDILKAPNGNSKILIEPAKGVATDVLKTELTSAMSQKRYSVTKIYDEAQVAAAAKQKALPCYLISFFSLIMSIFIIFSSYKVITMERLPVIGTFRSIGATEKATTKILMMESLLYGIIGGLIGIPLGYGTLKLMLEGLGKSLEIGIEIPMVVSPLNILLSCIVAVGVSMLSAYIPIHRASTLPVKDVVLGMVEEKKNSNKTKLGFGIVLFILSLVLPMIPGDKNNNLLMVAGGFSLLGLIVATIIVIPLIADTLSYVLERVYVAVLGNEGKLAARNMRQNKNINQNITLLFISLSAVIVISVVTSFTISYICDIFDGGALNGTASGDMSTEFVEKVKSIDSIEKVSAIYELDNKISVDSVLLGRMEGLDDLSLHNFMLNIKYEDEKTQKNIEDIFEKGRNILFNRDCLKKCNLNVGDTISLSYNGQAYKYKIIGSFKSRGDNSEAFIPGKYAKSDFGAVNYGTLTFTATNPDAVIVQIRNLFGNKYNWSRTIEEFYEDTMGVVSAFLEPMKKLTYFILLLAAIGIINNLLINYIQKRHAIAMYKSVGLSNRQNVKMTMIEGFTSGVIGAAIGLFVSYMELKTIFIVAGPRVSVEPEFDTRIFIMTGLAGIIITLVGSVVPILKGFKMKIVEEIKFE
ncbi:MAG TPA: FtsX-like permease family protein [Clostridia bacterium]|nr:FtsX-like permease family protein [Clostridia bacterium]